MQNGDYDAALAAIAEGLTADANNRQLLQLRGAVLLEKRDFEGALAAYEEFLSAKPRGANKRKAKKIVRNLQVVKSTFLKVNVTNGPVNVYLDTKSLGVVCVANPDCKRGMVPGRYRVYLVRDGFEEIRERIRIRANKTFELTKTLVEKPSDVTINVSPDTAEVSLDGEVLGTGVQSKQIPAGDHTVRVTAPGHADREVTLSAREGKPVAIDVKLPEVVAIKVSVQNAKLLLDGNEVEVKNGFIELPLGAGAVTLVATADGYEDKTVEIPAERDPDFAVDMTLEKTVVAPPPPPPPPKPSEWNSTKIAAVAGAGGLAVIGYGLGVGFAASASGKWSDAEELCQSDGGAGVLCGNPDGLQAGEDARSAASRANVSFALGTMAAVGAVWAWNMNETAPEGGGMSLRRKISIGTTAGIGALGLTVGTIYGIRAISGRSDSDKTCDDDLVCDRDGFVAATEARDDAGVSNLGFAVAGVAAAGSVLLWLLKPSPGETPGTALRIDPVMQPGQVGVSLSGGF